jgi:hypothetical protein
MYHIDFSTSSSRAEVFERGCYLLMIHIRNEGNLRLLVSNFLQAESAAPSSLPNDSVQETRAHALT